MAKQAERTAKTRGHIIAIATSIFAEKGYANTSLSDVVDQTGLTTGAIYHHFGGKQQLFIEVAKGVEQRILDEIVARSVDTGRGWESFEASVLLTLEICTRPDIQRIVFQDAPTVIGAVEWRAIEVQYGFGLMHRALEALNRNGIIKVANTELTAQMLLGALVEATHIVATSPRKAPVLKAAKATMRQLLSALPCNSSGSNK